MIKNLIIEEKLWNSIPLIFWIHPCKKYPWVISESIKIFDTQKLTTYQCNRLSINQLTSVLVEISALTRVLHEISSSKKKYMNWFLKWLVYIWVMFAYHFSERNISKRDFFIKIFDFSKFCKALSGRFVWQWEARSFFWNSTRWKFN